MRDQKPTALRRYIYQGNPLLAPPPPELAAILERHRGQPDALITVLEEMQDHYGYLPQQGVQYTPHTLGFPLSPPGRYPMRTVREKTA